MTRPINQTKPSNRRCCNCEYYKRRQPAQSPQQMDFCPTANKNIQYWNCCKQFQWDTDKIYTKTNA